MLRILNREHVAGDGTVRGLVEQLAELDRNSYAKKLELEDTAKGWQALAA